MEGRSIEEAPLPLLLLLGRGEAPSEAGTRRRAGRGRSLAYQEPFALPNFFLELGRTPLLL
jgi:hypothetical protein